MPVISYYRFSALRRFCSAILLTCIGSVFLLFLFFFSSRRRHTRSLCDWSSDVCSSDLTDPALRANPYPEVTDPACRLPLPTLFQHARGCSPWRPAADMGTARREIYTLSPGFSRASESSPDAAGTATLSKARAPLSGRTHSRAPCPSQRKEIGRASCRERV